MQIDFVCWGLCFVVLWISNMFGRMQGRIETDYIWEKEIKKIVDSPDKEKIMEEIINKIKKAKNEN